MFLDELTEHELLKVKELCALVNISKDDAVKLLKENDWDIALSSRRVSKDHDDRVIIPSTSKDVLGDWDELSDRFRVPGYAFYLPNLSSLPNEFRTFLERDLIETSTQRRLEASKHLNWWYQFGQKLYPLSTTGDGNCLLHAASLGMWGVHDRQLTLRETLFEMLINGSRKEALWRRWKWAEHNAIHSSELALTLSDEEWQQEWEGLVALASPVPRKQEDDGSNSTDQIYESLETIHVFALAHVLKRPIVVVSDTVLRNAKGEELSPVSFGGIYLPLECPPSQCHRSPLVLCYDSAHFSPLVPMRTDSTQKQIIPIIDVNRNLLPVHFAVDPGPSFSWWKNDSDASVASNLVMDEAAKLSLISEYMDIIRLDIRRGSIRSTRRVRSAHTLRPDLSAVHRQRELSMGACNDHNTKGMTLASSGISSGRNEKWRIINEITTQLLRTLRISTNNKLKEKTIDPQECIERMNSTCVLASELVPSHHQYMDLMVNEYMKSAKQRFQQNQKPTNSDGRKRISRSFSASSLMITCINMSCNLPASQATNFLCDECFERHKMMLLSFNCDKLISIGTSPCKSSTLPSFVNREKCEQENKQEVPKLDILERDGQSKTTRVKAIEDGDGVVHYYLTDINANDDATNNGHSVKDAS